MLRAVIAVFLADPTSPLSQTWLHTSVCGVFELNGKPRRRRGELYIGGRARFDASLNFPPARALTHVVEMAFLVTKSK
ncbi:Os04g0546900 [Oryza sativa Japonica Group]|uniref:Os04g0546900 protein n=1 Tax=Oryza sativa subsp. japonica TaxID=39947 RepID=A0A0N7KJG4_ORYSJ|nr:hypothetical protein EE612_024742 [Oryza sativa]BAS90345.1 Os04g0546900 [Oryza sativa Japonica Group]